MVIPTETGDDIIIELNKQIDRLWQERDNARDERDYYKAELEAITNPPEPKLLSTPGDYVTLVAMIALAGYGLYSAFMALFY